MFLPMRMYLALLGLLALAAVACSSSTGPSASNPCSTSGAAATVSATDNFAFTPGSVTVTVGQSVCWQNTGQLVHTVTDVATSGRRFSGNLPGSQAFVYTFGFGGTFEGSSRNRVGELRG